MKDYPKPPSVIAQGSTVLSTCSLPKLVDVPCEHIGACIVVHGVNDVGVMTRCITCSKSPGLDTISCLRLTGSLE